MHNEYLAEKRPAYPYTMSNVLAVFPLSEHSRKRYRNGSYIYRPEAKTTRTEIMSELLHPTEDTVLANAMVRGTSFDDAATAKRQRQAEVTQQHQVRQTETRIMAMLQSSPATSATPTPVLRQALGRPNQFGVRLVYPLQLYPYQCRAVQWMADLEERRINNQNYLPHCAGGLLAMVMGLGKTPCAGTLIMRTLRAQRAARRCTLYVCPKNLLGTVCREFDKFFGSQLRVQIYHKDFLRSRYREFFTSHICQYDVLVTTYHTILSRQKLAAKPHTYQSATKHLTAAESDHKSATHFVQFPWYRIVLDESHEIREKHKRFEAVSALHSPRRICMTGTPIHNSIRDLFHQLEFTGLRVPRGVKYTKKTLKQLGLMDVIRFVEYKDAEKDVRLPEKQIHVIHFALSKEERFLHQHYVSRAQYTFQQHQNNNGVSFIHVEASMIRVLQVCSAPYVMTPAAKLEAPKPEDHAKVVYPHNPQIDRWIKYRAGPSGLTSSKMQCFVKLVRNLRGGYPAEKMIVFGNFTSTLRLAIDALRQQVPDIQYRFVHGSVGPQDRREQMYTAFRTDPKVELLFMTLKTGNVGLNLTEASIIIFLEPWYSYGALHQAESRAHRIGQTKIVRVYYLLGADSLEERTYQIAQEKKCLAEDIAAQKDFKLRMHDLRNLLFNSAKAA